MVQGSGGHALHTAPCAQCGHIFPKGQKFCGECGGQRDNKRPSTSPAAPNVSPEAALSELKIVTVLFSDMCGFTSLSERLGVEELRDLMNGWFDRLTTLIPTFGGTIDKFIGDAVMALFGAPIAHENDPKRAIDAALAMQAELDEYNREVSKRIGQPMKIRIGINTGRVYAGMLGGDSHQSYTVMGDAVNVASRLESSCPIGSILISESTLEHVRGVYDFREQEPLRVKGKSEALTTFEILGRRRPSERTESNEDAVIALSRGEELANAIQLFDDVRVSARPELIAVLAEAGMAKNQFSSCLAHRLKGRHVAASLSTHCDAGVSAAPFQVLADWLGQAAGASVDLESYLRSCRLPDESIRILTHVMRVPDSALGPPAALGDPSALHHATLESAREWLRGLARRGPVLLRVHNLHNAPDATCDLLSYLTESENLPLLVVVTANPKLSDPESLWAPLLSSSAQLNLETLDADTSYEVAAHLLKPMKSASAKLIEQIAEASGGNPGFMEESVRALLAQGVLIETDTWELKDNTIPTPLPIPDTIGRMIQVRVDGLSPRSKLILQQATIVGPRFDAQILATLEEGDGSLSAAEIEEILREPLRAGLLSAERRTGGLPTEYRFRPAMVRDEIYETVVAKQRRAWHERYAKSLRQDALELSTVKAATLEDLAAHVERAGNHAEAAKLYRQAGDAAASVYANSDARNQYQAADRALQEAKGSATDRAEVLRLLGRMLALGGDHIEAQEAFGTAIDLLGDNEPLERAELEVELGRSFAASGDRAAARARYENAVALTDGLNDSESRTVLADAKQNLGWIRYLNGDLESAESLYHAALTLSERVEAGLIQARCHDALAVIERTRGKTPFAIEHSERALTLRRECNDRPAIATSHLNLGVVYFGAGEYEAARRSFNEALEVHLQRGNIDGATTAYLNLGASELELDMKQEALEHLEEAKRMALKSGAWYLPEVYRYCAEAALLSSAPEDARTLALEGMRLLGDDGPSELRGNLCSALGAIELHSRNLPAAVKYFEMAIGAHEVSQNTFELAVTLTRVSQLQVALGDLEIAKSELLRSRSLFEKAGNKTWLERTARALAALP
jgi:adenylate cyclase